jgi:hypothetical protein
MIFFRSGSGVLWRSGYGKLYRPDNGLFFRSGYGVLLIHHTMLYFSCHFVMCYLDQNVMNYGHKSMVFFCYGQK